jgi:beta-aspartyl-peptidase (threonine type)
MNPFTIAIHGGAGTILRSSLTKDQELNYKNALEKSILAGEKTLSSGGSAIEAITAAITVMEDDPLFNAGKGSVFNHEGKNEMDAAIMNGKDLKAGAVAGVRNVRNPILLAKAIMEQSEHVMLSGEGAAAFAKTKKLQFENDDYFFTQNRYDQLKQALKEGSTLMDHTDKNVDKKFGTVGAVALDVHGNIAAGTSTGGMTNKQWGRIGDCPVIGAGTYANNNTCAISCTGHGEYFIRAVAAYDVSCLMEYKGFSLKEACDLVVNKKLVSLGGEGGLIAIDAKGNIELPFNSQGMYRAMKKEGEKLFIGIYRD